MATSIQIDDLDDLTVERLQSEAARRGIDFKSLIAEILREKAATTTASSKTHHDLDALAGTWSEEEANEFLANIADLGQIDPTLWK